MKGTDKGGKMSNIVYMELQEEIKNKKNKLITILLKNKHQFIIAPEKVKMMKKDDLLIIEEIERFKKTIYKILIDEIIGIEIYQN